MNHNLEKSTDNAGNGNQQETDERFRELQSRITALEMYTGYGKGGRHINIVIFSRVFGVLVGNALSLAVTIILYRILLAIGVFKEIIFP